MMILTLSFCRRPTNPREGSVWFPGVLRSGDQTSTSPENPWKSSWGLKYYIYGLITQYCMIMVMLMMMMMMMMMMMITYYSVQCGEATFLKKPSATAQHPSSQGSWLNPLDYQDHHHDLTDIFSNFGRYSYKPVLVPKEIQSPGRIYKYATIVGNRFSFQCDILLYAQNL